MTKLDAKLRNLATDCGPCRSGFCCGRCLCRLSENEVRAIVREAQSEERRPPVLKKTTVIVPGGGVEASSPEEALRLAAQMPKEMRLDGHRVREAVREAQAIRATTFCGKVVMVSIPVVASAHDTKAPVICPQCLRGKP